MAMSGVGGGSFLRGEYATNIGARGESGGDLSEIFSVVLNRHRHPHHAQRWRFFSVSTRSFWTKYCLLCTICGSAATILAGIFLVVAALFRYYTTSVYYFETVPTYVPAILLSICGVSTIAFSCKRNRNIILLRITACWSLVSAALSSVITITTSLIHMNRLQTLRECTYNPKQNPPSCICLAHTLSEKTFDFEPVHYIFENTPDCDVIHGTLYSCLRAVFAGSVVAVLLSIFLCMLLYQLIGHERKKAYWSRIRRINNSDWNSDFIACLGRPMPRERSSMLPLIMSPSSSMPLSMSMGGQPMIPPGILATWGPPPPYEERTETQASGSTADFVNVPTSASITFVGLLHNQTQEANPVQLLNCAHPFSPTITSVDPTFNQNNNHSTNNNHHNNTHNNSYCPSLSRLTDSSTDSSESERMLNNPNQQLSLVNHSNQQLFSVHNNNTTTTTTTTITSNGEEIDDNHLHHKGLLMKSDESMCWSETRDLHHPHHRLKDMDVSSGMKSGSNNNGHYYLPNNNGRMARNFRISSLPNSPILMNVRRFCNFRLSEKEKKKSNSTNKLDSVVTSQSDKTNTAMRKSSQSITDDDSEKHLPSLNSEEIPH